MGGKRDKIKETGRFINRKKEREGEIFCMNRGEESNTEKTERAGGGMKGRGE